MSAAQADIATIIRFDPQVTQQRDAITPSTTHEKQCRAATPGAAPAPRAGMPVKWRTRAPIPYALIALALFGAAGAWWSAGGRRPATVPASTNATPAVSLAPPSPTVIASTPVALSKLRLDEGAVDPVRNTETSAVAKKVQKRVAKRENAAPVREPRSKRPFDNSPAPEAAVAGGHRTADANRVQAATPRANEEALVRLAKLKSLQQTPQQACADRSNFISRGICEARECEKAERATLKFCVDMRERRASRVD